MYLRIYWKIFKCNIGLFFNRNRKINWSIRGVCWVLLATVTIGFIGGRELSLWVNPDAYTIRYRVSRDEGAQATRIVETVNASAGVDGRTKDNLVQIEEGGAMQELGQAPSIEEKIKESFPNDPIMLAIAKAESRLDNSRIGDEHLPLPSYCIFQVNRYWNPQYSVEELQTIDGCLKASQEIYDYFEKATGDGKNGWSTWKNLEYKKFM